MQPPGWQGGEAEALDGQQLRWAHQLGRPARAKAHAQQSTYGRGSRRAADRPRLSAIAATVPVGERSVAVEVLLMSLSFGIFCSRVGREGMVAVLPASATSPAEFAPSTMGSGVFEVDG